MANKLIHGEQGETPAPKSDADTRVWMYRNGEAKLFDSLESVPSGEGWTDSPAAAAPEPETPKRKRKVVEVEVDDDGNSD